MAIAPEWSDGDSKNIELLPIPFPVARLRPAPVTTASQTAASTAANHFAVINLILASSLCQLTQRTAALQLLIWP